MVWSSKQGLELKHRHFCWETSSHQTLLKLDWAAVRVPRPHHGPDTQQRRRLQRFWQWPGAPTPANSRVLFTKTTCTVISAIGEAWPGGGGSTSVSSGAGDTLWPLPHCSWDACTPEAGAPHTSVFLALGITRSWGQADSWPEELYSRPHQPHDPNSTLKTRDDRESAAVFPELAHCPPTHSLSLNLSNVHHHSLTQSVHSLLHMSTQQALIEHLLCTRSYFEYHGRCQCQMSDITTVLKKHQIEWRQGIWK